MTTQKYGGTGTIHRTGHVDVETDAAGNVVGVWFRCLFLPFKQSRVAEGRVKDLRSSYSTYNPIRIESIEFES